MAAVDFKDGISFTGVANGGTVGPFTLIGGLYNFGYDTTVVSSGTGSATLTQEMPDGGYVPAPSGGLTTPGSVNIPLPPGSYEVVAATTSGSTVNGVVVRVPYRAA